MPERVSVGRRAWRRRMLPGALLPFLLAGCALNALRIEDAQRVDGAAAAATDGASAFLAAVDSDRERTNLDLAAADPACAALHPVLLSTPRTASDAPSVGFLCAPAGSPDDGATLSLLPISDEFGPTLTLIQALSAYSDALAATVDPGNARPPSVAIGEALELAHAAQSALTAVTGAAPGPIPGTNDARVKAAANLIDFLGELSVEATKVKALRSFVSSHPDGASTIVELLKRRISSWDTARAGDVAIRTEIVGAMTARALDAIPPLTPEARRRALEALYAERDEARAERLIAPTLLKALDAVAAADANLRRVLQPGPKLTANERSSIAALNRQRLITALNQVAALATALRKG